MPKVRQMEGLTYPGWKVAKQLAETHACCQADTLKLWLDDFKQYLPTKTGEENACCMLTTGMRHEIVRLYVVSVLVAN